MSNANSSAIQLSIQNSIQILHSQLANFGLNPAQWEHEKGSPKFANIIRFRNKRDRDFRMQARLRRVRDHVAISELRVLSF